MTKPAVMTVGHSTHAIGEFLGLLEAHGVTSVADVRSTPYSRYQPQFNRDALCRALEERGISYDFLGSELGARSEDPSCYENGRVQYRRLAGKSCFRDGLDRVMREARERCIALLCAEKEPLECHRTLLVAQELANMGISVSHIHADGRLETQTEAMTRLLSTLGMPEMDLFLTREQLLEEACARQEFRIAHVNPSMHQASHEEHAE